MKRKEWIVVAALLSVILASGLYYAVTNSITTDERSHITTGYINLKLNDYRFNIEHPPFIKQLAALPLLCMNLEFPYDVYRASSIGMDLPKIQKPFLFEMGNNLDRIVLFSRIPGIFIALLLGVFIYLYSKRINGTFAGIISLALFAFSPNFLGHSPLVTTDVGVSCFYFITIYFLMRYFKDKRELF